MDLLRVAEVLSVAGKNFNEDRARIHGTFAWIIDGSSGLGSRRFTDAPTDAVWFVDQVDRCLLSIKTKEPSPASLRDILRGEIEKFRGEIDEKWEIDAMDKFEFPSASIALVRFRGNALDYLVLGDVTIAIHTSSEDIILVQDNRINRFDEDVLKKLRAIQQEENLRLQEAVSRIKPLLIQNRAKMNTKAGYWILGRELQAVDKAIQGSFSLEKIKQIMLASDGVSALMDRYQAFTWREIFGFLQRENLAAAFEILRAIEEMDPEGQKYPRFKKSDDASAIHIDLTGN